MEVPDRDEKVGALWDVISSQLILLECSAYEDRGLRIEPHTLIDDPHCKGQALEILEGRLAITNHFIYLTRLSSTQVVTEDRSCVADGWSAGSGIFLSAVRRGNCLPTGAVKPALWTMSHHRKTESGLYMQLARHIRIRGQICTMNMLVVPQQ